MYIKLPSEHLNPTFTSHNTCKVTITPRVRDNVKVTKNKEECHILNLLLLYQLKIISYIKFIKIII